MNKQQTISDLPEYGYVLAQRQDLQHKGKLCSVQTGRVYARYILGVYDLADRLMTAFPEVFFEGCAGGGGRFDAMIVGLHAPNTHDFGAWVWHIEAVNK